MLNLEWNALRRGDNVLVHDPRSQDMALTTGVVALFDTHRHTNNIGIRLPGAGGQGPIVWPSRLAVHPDPRDATEACWRCQELEDRVERLAPIYEVDRSTAPSLATSPDALVATTS